MAKDKMRIDAFLSEFGKSMIQAQAQINAEVLEHPVGFEGLTNSP
ncbi:MAG: hypothetical protein RIM23_01380 [Coleofasciculus sp. G3-WIS-01]